MEIRKAKEKRWRRLLWWILLVPVCCGVLLVGFVVWSQYHLPPVVDSDVILVLGAQVKPDGSPSEILSHRLQTALRLYQEKPQRIITCGARGDNEPVAEGEMMRDYLIERGVHPEHITAETRSFNTRQNLRYASEIMADKGLSQATIVTSDYHVARALTLARQEGISATGIGGKTYWIYLPRNYCREALSWIKVWMETLQMKLGRTV